MTSAIDLFIEAVRAVTVLDVAAIRSSRIFPSIPCRIALSPALALLKSKLPQDDKWSYEIKWDGYRSGRTGDWLKIKCIQSDSFAIIGYEPSTALPGAIASLLLGARYRDG
jgi:ATP-dependent DNA ligase